MEDVGLFLKVKTKAEHVFVARDHKMMYTIIECLSV